MRASTALAFLLVTCALSVGFTRVLQAKLWSTAGPRGDGIVADADDDYDAFARVETAARGDGARAPAGAGRAVDASQEPVQTEKTSASGPPSAQRVDVGEIAAVNRARDDDGDDDAALEGDSAEDVDGLQSDADMSPEAADSEEGLEANVEQRGEDDVALWVADETPLAAGKRSEEGDDDGNAGKRSEEGDDDSNAGDEDLETLDEIDLLNADDASDDKVTSASVTGLLETSLLDNLESLEELQSSGVSVQTSSDSDLALELGPQGTNSDPRSFSEPESIAPLDSPDPGYGDALSAPTKQSPEADSLAKSTPYATESATESAPSLLALASDVSSLLDADQVQNFDDPPYSSASMAAATTPSLDIASKPSQSILTSAVSLGERPPGIAYNLTEHVMGQIAPLTLFYTPPRNLSKIPARIRDAVSKFESPACRAVRAAPSGIAADNEIGMRSRAKCQRAMAESDEILHERGSQVLISEAYKVIYVSNMKAASQLINKIMRNRFNATAVGSHNIKKYIKERQRVEPGVRLEDYFVFTFVRDPVRMFYSAYAEIDRRMEIHQKEPQAFQKIERNMANEPERARACLDMVRSGSFLRGQLTPAHMHTQVFKTQRCPRGLDNFLRFDFIGKLENVKKDIRALESVLGVPHRPFGRINANKKTVYKRHIFDLEMVAFESLEKEVCAYSAADYACFPYEKPVNCQL